MYLGGLVVLFQLEQLLGRALAATLGASIVAHRREHGKAEQDAQRAECEAPRTRLAALGLDDRRGRLALCSRIGSWHCCLLGLGAVEHDKDACSTRRVNAGRDSNRNYADERKGARSRTCGRFLSSRQATGTRLGPGHTDECCRCGGDWV